MLCGVATQHFCNPYGEITSHNTFCERGRTLYIFKAKTEVYYNSEIGFYTSCGVEVFDELSDKSIYYIRDVFANENLAREFIELMNIHQPELVHLEELCMDFIG